MDTDSLLVHRIAALTRQPNTLRGKTIRWYAQLNGQPTVRVALYLLFTIVVLIHFIAFCVLLKVYVVNVTSPLSPCLTVCSLEN